MFIHDLTMPIETDHFRWPVVRTKKGDFETGDLFEVTSIATSCHAFTHMDAPCHMVPDGKTLSQLDLDVIIGDAAVIDLSDCVPNLEITSSLLKTRSEHMQHGDRILFKTCWYQQRDWRTEAYWREAPYLSRDACEWMLAQKPAAIAFDFPQDYTIRCILDGEMRPIEEHVSHDVLLRNGITLIEYLIGTHAIETKHVELIALPLNIPLSDGAPARVIARAKPIP